MTAQAPPSRADLYLELEALPPNLVGEIVDDRLWVSPRPAVPHALGSSVLGALLLTRFQLGEGGPGGWWILDEPELHLGSQVMVPDIAGWRHEGLASLPLSQATIQVPPAWICEVLSPSTARLDRAWKLRAYGEAGVQYAWLFDPVAGTLEVFVRQDARWTLERVHTPDDGPVVAPPFAEVPLDLSPVWGPPATPPQPSAEAQELAAEEPPEQG